jgi:alpha-tubulin suppressor-like RCC1 family protein
MSDLSNTFAGFGKFVCPFQPPDGLSVLAVAARFGLALFVCSDGVVRIDDSNRDGLDAYLGLKELSFPRFVMRVALSDQFALFASVDHCAFKVSKPSPHGEGTVEILTSIHAPVVDVACGLHHGLVLINDGSIYSIGSNAHGQRGLTNLEINDSILRQVDIPSNLFVTQISCGGIHSVAIASKELIIFGSNREGQLGIENEVN